MAKIIESTWERRIRAWLSRKTPAESHRNAEGAPGRPSLRTEDGEILVGASPTAGRHQWKNTIYAKRLIGRRLEEKEVQKDTPDAL
jgi:hypothetical protein